MTNQDRWYSKPSQRAWVCKALMQGRVLSTKEEIREMNGWRLAAVIHVLAQKYYWPIESEYRGKDNIKHYWLRPGTDPTSLKFPPSAAHLAEGVAQ